MSRKNNTLFFYIYTKTEKLKRYQFLLEQQLLPLHILVYQGVMYKYIYLFRGGEFVIVNLQNGGFLSNICSCPTPTIVVQCY